MTMYLNHTGTYLPGPACSNQEIAARFGMHAGWLEKLTGNRSRHYATDFVSGNSESLTSMATKASRAVLEKMAGEVALDFVILSTATPDELMPATVHQVMDRLGLNRISGFQVQGGCSGALQALRLASALLNDGASNGLVIGADTCQKYFEANSSKERLSPQELVNIAMFGDGAGAVHVSSQPASGCCLFVNDIFVQFNGLGLSPGQVARWYGPNGNRHTEIDATVEDYKAIEERVPRLTAEVFERLRLKLSWHQDDVDRWLIPQLSGRMSAGIQESLGVPEHRAVHCVADTGNNGNALPLLQMDALMRVVRPGEKILGAAIESSKWITGGIALTACEGRS